MISATKFNLASILTQNAKLTPDNEAIVCGPQRITYRELDEASSRVANALSRLGYGIGDNVALMCPNLPYFPIIYFGIVKCGAAVVPLCVLFKANEIEYHLRDSEAKAIFAFQGTDELPMLARASEAFRNVEACEHLIALPNPQAETPDSDGITLFNSFIANETPVFEMRATSPDDTCAILYTSGTTGQPKGAELTHLNIWSNVIATHEIMMAGRTQNCGEQKTSLITLPLFHTTGQTVQMNTGLYAGDRIVLLPRFEPKMTLDTMAAEKVNSWVGVPTMYWALLNYAEQNDYDTTSIAENMSVAKSGGAPMPLDVMKAFEKRFNVRVLEGYGLSETSPLATFNHMQRPSKPGTVGQSIFGVDVKCFDNDDNEVPRGTSGEVVIRGPNVMKGYYKRPDATAEAFRNGWFHTGDIGMIDEDGYLTIVDRKKDMILRGGYNVYPRELEELIITHPAVSLVAVIGVPDERLGEEVKAFVVLKKGEALSEAELIEWCRERIAANKYPRFVEFRDELPIGNTGKILKRA
ncbi:MAG: acyl-CoA synthetase /AMP-acid ligase II [Acidobacteria bacterium OLB17]|nr:MAG: acyl-CoA synthetase /AMP-acid ligase II [Acidobacteria bacterium OLB17]